MSRNCIKCSGPFKKIGIFRTKGWKCNECKGVFIRFKYLSTKDIMRKKLKKTAKKADTTNIRCIECESLLKKFNLEKSGLQLDFCPNDFNIFFDVREPEAFQRWMQKHHPPESGWKNSSEVPYKIILIGLHMQK